jgi:hypothetical protein
MSFRDDTSRIGLHSLSDMAGLVVAPPVLGATVAWIRVTWSQGARASARNQGE